MISVYMIQEERLVSMTLIQESYELDGLDQRTHLQDKESPSSIIHQSG